LIHTRKDGRQIVVDSRHRVIRLGGRSVVIESNRDITAQRAAEAEVRASESLFRSLAQNAPVGIFRAAANGYATWANPRLLEIWGMTEAEFLGLGWISRVHPDDLNMLASEIRISDSSDGPTRLHYRLALSGGVRFVEVVTAPVTDPEGRPGLVGAV